MSVLYVISEVRMVQTGGRYPLMPVPDHPLRFPNAEMTHKALIQK